MEVPTVRTREILSGHPTRTHPEAFNIEQGSEAGLCLSWCTGVSGSWESSWQYCLVLMRPGGGGGGPLFPLVIPSSCCQPTRKDPSLGPQSRGNFSILLGCLYHENTLLPESKSQSRPRKSQALICGHLSGSAFEPPASQV